MLELRKLHGLAGKLCRIIRHLKAQQFDSNSACLRSREREKMPLTNWRAFRKTRRRQTDLDRAKHASPGRSSPLSDLPLAGLTGRWQFCHECAAMVTKWSQPKDEDDNGQRL